MGGSQRDALCLKEDKGLDWYRRLAEEHQLAGAREYIAGFYGTLFGKVEIIEDDAREPASHAEVTLRSPRDERDWQVTANRDGEYEIEEVPLHERCGPYAVEARHEAGIDFAEYEGPIKEPSVDYRHQQDLEIECNPVAGAKLTIEHDALFAQEVALHRLDEILDTEGLPAEVGSRLIICAEIGRVDPYILPDGLGVRVDTWQNDQRCGAYAFQGQPLLIAYRAPKPDVCGSDEETIRIFNACPSRDGKKVPLKATRRGKEIAQVKHGLVCVHPRYLHLHEKEKATRVHKDPEGDTVCDHRLQVSARVGLGEARSWRNIRMQGKETGWAKTKLPFETMEITEFDASIVCRGKNPGVYIGSDLRSAENERRIEKRELTLYHPWEDYRLVEYIRFRPIYFDYDAGFPDGRRWTVDFFFIDHTYETVETELPVGIRWLDQRVRSFLDVNHFEGSGHRFKDETHTWWNWKVE